MRACSAHGRSASGNRCSTARSRRPCSASPGAVAITAATFYADGDVDAGPLHNPGEGGYFTLDPGDITVIPDAG